MTKLSAKFVLRAVQFLSVSRDSITWSNWESTSSSVTLAMIDTERCCHIHTVTSVRSFTSMICNSLTTCQEITWHAIFAEITTKIFTTTRMKTWKSIFLEVTLCVLTKLAKPNATWPSKLRMSWGHIWTLCITKGVRPKEKLRLMLCSGLRGRNRTQMKRMIGRRRDRLVKPTSK